MPADKFDNIPKIRVDLEDRQGFHQTRHQSSGNKDDFPDSTSKQPQPQQAAATSGSFSVWVGILLVLVMGALACSYWLYQQYVGVQQALTDSQQRLASVEQTLSITGEEMGQSAVALQAKLSDLDVKTAEHWQQIDKLWASAWRRNQSEIKQLKTQQAGSKAADEKFDKVAEKIDSQLNTQLAKLQQLQQSIQSQVQLLEIVQAELPKLNRADNKNVKSVAGLTQRLDVIAQDIEQIIERLQKVEQHQADSNQPAPQPTQLPRTLPPAVEPLTVG